MWPLGSLAIASCTQSDIKGYFRGSIVLITGTPGVGKTTLAAHFANACGLRGELCIYSAFEESEQQILRNMRSVGIQLGRWVRKGLLQFNAARPTLRGLEMHLAIMQKQIEELRPAALIVDPVSSLENAGSRREDFLKLRQVTVLMTQLTSNAEDLLKKTEVGLSSLMDTWLLARDMELNGERNRTLYVLKSRGMAHSNQIREFLLSNKGIKLVDVYLGPSGMLTGSARVALEEQERLDRIRQNDESDLKLAQLEHKRKAMEAHIEAMRAEFEADSAAVKKAVSLDNKREKMLIDNQSAMAKSRRVNGHLPQTPNKK